MPLRLLRTDLAGPGQQQRRQTLPSGLLPGSTPIRKEGSSRTRNELTPADDIFGKNVSRSIDDKELRSKALEAAGRCRHTNECKGRGGTSLALLRGCFDGRQDVGGHFVQLDILMLGHKREPVIRYRLHHYILHRDRSAGERHNTWHSFLGRFCVAAPERWLRHRGGRGLVGP